MLDSFIDRAAFAGIAAAILAAPLGCFIVWRRMAYFGENIAYSGLLGVAMGFLLGINLIVGVIVAAIITSLVVSGFESQRTLPRDAFLGILAHTWLALGLIAASLLEGARLDLMGYLFGDILAVSKSDVAYMWLGAATSTLALFWLWSPLLALSVNRDLAEAEGVKVRRTELVFMLLIALAVALTMKVIGLVLMTSLMIFPAAIARVFARSPEQMAVCGVAVGTITVLGGLTLSVIWDTPAGPSIVAVMAALFFAVAAPLLHFRSR